jgi:ATP-dependent Lon protease
MEFIEVVARNKDSADFINIHLRTIKDDYKPASQLEFFESIQLNSKSAGINFTWEFDSTETIHARHIVTDTGWKISLDRGLDIFQQYDMNNTFSLSNKLQKFRSCKAFEITYIRK